MNCLDLPADVPTVSAPVFITDFFQSRRESVGAVWIEVGIC